MNLGILDCIPPIFYETVQDVREHVPFEKLLRAAGFEGIITPYHVANNEFPENPQACDAYLVTGSPASAYEDEAWIDRLKHFIRDVREAGVPLVGICFGHQIIAEALGGRVAKSEVGWQAGLYEFEVIQPTSFMDNSPINLKLYHLNQDQVIDLPPDAVRLGTSTTCNNMMYMVGDTVFSIQGHPEMMLPTLKHYVGVLEDTLTSDEIAYARASIESDKPDKQIVAGWILNFLLGVQS